MNLKCVSLILLIAIFNLIKLNANVLNIHTQEQFDAAVQHINNGEEMNLRLASRQFFLKSPINAKAKLSIKGNGAIISCFTQKFDSRDAIKITDEYYVYKIKSPINYYPLFYGADGNIIQLSESVVDSIAVNLVEGEIIAPSVFSEGIQLKIPISSNLSYLKNKSFSQAFGYFDCGWQVINFSIDRSDKMYFYCTTLNVCRTKNFEYDKKAYKKPIRYVLYNIEKKNHAIFYDNNFLYIPKRYDVVYLINRLKYDDYIPSITTYSDFILDGVSFIGFDGINVNSDIEDKCVIKNCHFENSLNYAILLNKKNGEKVQIANISNCIFKNCSIHTNNIVLLYSSFNSSTCINFYRCSLSRSTNGFAIYKNPGGGLYVDGDAAIINNEIFNCSRCHLYCNRGMIIANGNFIYNTDLFSSYLYRNLSSDWGLVYCNHIFNDTQKAFINKLHRIILNNNLLYGAYAYGNNARGIFIDDGRGDVECKDNIILNTQLYSIDSRNEKTKEASSVRNHLKGNIITTRYRLGGGVAVHGKEMPISNANIQLNNQKNLTTNSKIIKDDIIIDILLSYRCSGNKLIVSKELFRHLKKSTSWRFVKSYITCENF